jgi:hypothetical protein
MLSGCQSRELRNLCYIVTCSTYSIRYTMCKAIQALRAMPAASNKIPFLWQHGNLMRDEQMNMCMDNVVFLDIVSCNPTSASAYSPLTPQRLFYYKSRFHMSVNLSFTFSRGADKSLARPTSRCILFDGENTSFDASFVIYIYIYI